MALLEADYELEAANLRQARALFDDGDGIVVPRVFPQFSTGKVLTMERLDGLHLREFMSTNPSQSDRNDVAVKLVRAWYRLMYAGRMLYIDFHPGNFLVLPDGRVGVLDFGFIVSIDGEEWDLYRRMDRPLTTGNRQERIAILKEWSDIRDDETDHLRLADEFAAWQWMSRHRGAEYDFSDEAEFRMGINLFTEMVYASSTQPKCPRHVPRSPAASSAGGRYCTCSSADQHLGAGRRGSQSHRLGPQRLREHMRKPRNGYAHGWRGNTTDDYCHADLRVEFSHF